MNKKNSEELDIFFGPRVFANKKEIIALFMKKFTFKVASLPSFRFDPEDYSNTLYFPILSALKKKMGVVGIEVPFVYPPMQKKNEEQGAKELFIEKRKAQKLSIILELIHFVKIIHGREPSKKL